MSTQASVLQGIWNVGVYTHDWSVSRGALPSVWSTNAPIHPFISFPLQQPAITLSIFAPSAHGEICSVASPSAQPDFRAGFAIPGTSVCDRVENHADEHFRPGNTSSHIVYLSDSKNHDASVSVLPIYYIYINNTPCSGMNVHPRRDTSVVYFLSIRNLFNRSGVGCVGMGMYVWRAGSGIPWVQKPLCVRIPGRQEHGYPVVQSLKKPI